MVCGMLWRRLRKYCMPPKLKEFLLRWANTTVGVFLASYIVTGIQYRRPVDLLMAALLLGILNAFLRFWLTVLFLPLVILTIGLFVLVINALLLYLVGWLMAPHFEVATFWSAFWGALTITVVSFFLNVLTGTGNSRIRVQRGGPPPNPPKGPPPGGGPVIDV
jgi:putative membrane protein